MFCWGVVLFLFVWVGCVVWCAGFVLVVGVWGCWVGVFVGVVPLALVAPEWTCEVCVFGR